MDLRHDEGTRCSDLRLDRYLSGEVDDEARGAFEAHLAASAPCRRRCERLEEDRRRFLERPATGATGELVRPASRRGRRRLLGASVAVAASLGLILWQPAEAPSERSKGRSFVVHTARDGVVSELVDGGHLRPGDRLRFSFPGAAGRRVAVVGRDGSGRTAPYLPAEGDTLPLADSSQPVEGAVALDAVPGDERLYGFVCGRTVPVDRLAAAVQEAGEDAAPQVEGCTVHRLTVAKDTEPPHGR